MGRYKHTPAPWVVENHHVVGRYQVIMQEEGDDISDPTGVVVHSDIGHDAQANAHLIAAAPDLLEALEYFFDHATTEALLGAGEMQNGKGKYYIRGGGLARMDNAMNKAKVAIAKAKGDASCK